MKKACMAVIGLMVVVVMGVFVGCKPKDTTPPTVSIVVEPTTEYESEIDGNVIKGVAKVIATATDDVGVEEVIFFVNDAYVWQPMAHSDEDTTVTAEGDEYTFFWQTQELEDSVMYSIRAAAYDEAGNADTSEALTYLIRIPNEPPDPAELLRPVDDNVLSRASVELRWRGSDPDRYPTQELIYDVYFGESASNLERVADSLPDVPGTDTFVTWNTSQIEDFYLVPETDYYWMILTKDPYGLETESEVFHFERGENRSPSLGATPVPGDTDMVIDYPEGGELKLLWTITDPDGDPVTYDLYFGVDPGTDPVYMADLSIIANDLESSDYEVQVSAETVYYWRPLATDLWGAHADPSAVKAWSITVNE